MSTTNGVLTEAETLQLLTRAIEGSPDGRMAEDDLVRIGQWASETKVNSTLLEMVLAGSVAVNMEDGELVFSRAKELVEIVA